PCRNTSGGAAGSPATRTAVGVPWTSRSSRSNGTVVTGVIAFRSCCFAAGRAGHARSLALRDARSCCRLLLRTEPRDDLFREQGGVLHDLPVRHVAEGEVEVQAAAARLLDPAGNGVGHLFG